MECIRIHNVSLCSHGSKSHKEKKAQGSIKKGLREFFIVISIFAILGVSLQGLINYEAYKSIIINAFANTSIQGNYNIPIPKIDKPVSELSTQNIPKDTPQIAPVDNRINIPSINQNVPIVWPSSKHLEQKNFEAFENSILQELENGVAHYPLTAKPGETGNFVITGHSSYYPWAQGDYKNVFALLEKNIRKGDEIDVFYNGKNHTYKVTNLKTVKPQDIDVLSQETNKKKMTIITCTPVGTAINRFVVEAELIEK